MAWRDQAKRGKDIMASVGTVKRGLVRLGWDFMVRRGRARRDKACHGVDFKE